MFNKKILITGGAGFLGSNLARRILQDNEVTLFVRPGTDLWRISDIKNHKNIMTIERDLLDKEKVIEAIKDKDYIYHFAWQTDLKKSMENPVEDLKNDIGGLLNILENCRKYNKNVKIIFASTVTVVGIPIKITVNEDEKENPLSIYDANKLLAEKYLKIYYENYRVKNCILRLSNVFGEYQRIDNHNRGVLNFMIGKALRQEDLTVYGDGNFIRDYSYVQNYLDAFVLAGENENTDGNTYIIGSGEGKTFNEVVKKIKEIFEILSEKIVNIKHIEVSEDNKINQRNFIADFSKFNKDTGWKPKISFEEGLRKTVEFYVNFHSN